MKDDKNKEKQNNEDKKKVKEELRKKIEAQTKIINEKLKQKGLDPL